jgi:hypothetical protein
MVDEDSSMWIYLNLSKMDEKEYKMHLKIEFLKMYQSWHVTSFNFLYSIDLNCQKWMV